MMWSTDEESKMLQNLVHMNLWPGNTHLMFKVSAERFSTLHNINFGTDLGQAITFILDRLLLLHIQMHIDTSLHMWMQTLPALNCSGA